ncbi:DUF6542 domain-containing protein [Mycolicibacterium sp.]|uniref:DUF6542 domain-containing protein n=1 Tax=Mycolicibacterium sp. TaxID=2320850 RepID=UPI001A2CCB1B|nr:DUF6542 domain-containing protein [Mycolicibacterium sp.]MBJ7337797.1 hypothetical protein [Mycolicibacterium sp.]
MSGLRGRSAVAADHQSALPRVPGIPWWGSAILAATLTAIGVAFDAGSNTDALGTVFAVCYVLGCIAAVVAVRQSGVFTAVIQPPLILFVAVPFAYFVFHGSTFTGIKDTLINCGYPLIERFPLMFFTSATVLLIGMVRWYLGAAARRAAPKDADPIVEVSDDVAATTKQASSATRTRRSSRTTAAAATAAAAVGAMEDEAPRTPRRSSRTSTTGSERSTGAAASTGSRRSRHTRPPQADDVEPAQSRPRRRSTPPVDPPAEPRRRPRSTDQRDRETREPRDRRPLPPLDRRNSAYERPERERYERPQRRERPEAYERAERPERTDRPQRRPYAADYEAYEPPAGSRPNNSGGTHHPVSRVRYRGSDDGESRTEHRSKPRRPRHSAPDSWD